MADATEMQVKATLAGKIGEIIKHRHLTQIQAAEILGMPQPKLSGMLRGQFRGISEAKMLECLNRLGRDVEIVVLVGAYSPRKWRSFQSFAPPVTTLPVPSPLARGHRHAPS